MKLKLNFKYDVQVQLEDEVEFYFEINIDLDTIFDNKLVNFNNFKLKFYSNIMLKLKSKFTQKYAIQLQIHIQDEQELKNPKNLTCQKKRKSMV